MSSTGRDSPRDAGDAGTNGRARDTRGRPVATDAASVESRRLRKLGGGGGERRGAGKAPGPPGWVVTLLGLALVGGLLYAAKPILLPLALAGLLAFLLSPLCEWLEHRRVPRVAATVIVVVLAGLVLAGVGATLYVGVTRLTQKETIEAYTDRFTAKARSLSLAGGGEPGVLERVQEGAAEVGEALTERAEQAGEALGTGDGVDDEEQATTRPAEGEGGGVDETDLAVAQARLLDQISRRLARQDDPEESAVVAAIDAASERVVAVVGSARDRIIGTPLRVREVPADTSPIQQLGNYLAYLAGPLGTAGLIVIFLLFILLQRDDLRDRIIKLTAGREINLATQALDDASRRIARYLGAQCLVNGTYGVAIGLGLLGIGYAVGGGWFPGVILWAILCFALRFIPYLGPWLAASMPLLVSLGHFDGFGVFLAVAAMFVTIELFSNNVMEPMLYGQAVGMSDFAVIIAATVWTFLWGPVGLLVATPLTTCLVVLGKHVPALAFFNTLLGDEPVLSPDSRLYQRLLAMDADDAADEVETYRKEHTLTETYDTLLLPTLALAETDREGGDLTVERSDFIRSTMHDLVEQLAEQEGPLPSDSVDMNEDGAAPAGNERARDVPVAILPARDEADETAAEMLKALLDRRGFPVTVIADDALASEKLEAIVQTRAELVVVSALPPGAVTAARYLVKRLDGSGLNIDIPIVVGLWGAQGDLDRAESRITGHLSAKHRDAQAVSRRHVRLVRTLAEAAETVRNRAEVIAAKKPSVTKIATMA